MQLSQARAIAAMPGKTLQVFQGVKKSPLGQIAVYCSLANIRINVDCADAVDRYARPYQL